jgi:hypothetical protein
MATELFMKMQSQAAEELNRREDRDDGERVVRSLMDGLTVLKNQAYERMHQDVEAEIGADSMLMPISLVKTEQRTLQEIELFQIAESTLVAREHYIRSDSEWFVPWLTQLRLGDEGNAKECQQRLAAYLHQSADDRRLHFGDVMADVFPMSRRAPLVLFRLLPRAAQVATALAFGDHLTASEFRSRQLFHLPAIEDCQDCHGMLLDNGEKCRRCGNPVWNHEWLTSAD